MNKKDLLAMRPLRATTDMMETEWADTPQKVSDLYGGPYRKYARFARCQVESGILKVALFFPDNLRTGGYLPSYEVFIDRAAGKFITYDRMTDKWRTAKLDNLDWPRYIRATDGTWMSPADTKTVQTYLGGDRGGYDGVLDYQEKIREEALVRRHRKVTDAWDADLSPTRGLPKDWNRWVDKVGVQQNYIFYHYKKRGAKQGYCTYCGKNVPISNPRYNKTVRCPCCRHEAVFKSFGKLDRLFTGWNCVYLLQPRPDGFVVREFWAARLYTKVSWETPEVICMEQLRTIYDSQLNPRTYFWWDYKHRGLRWIEGMPNPSWLNPQSSYYCHGDRPGQVYVKGLSQLFQSKLGGTGIARFLHGDHSFEGLLKMGNCVYGYARRKGGRYTQYVFQYTPENIAHFIGAHMDASEITVTDTMDRLILNTAGRFIDRCPDQALLERVKKMLIPIQMGRAEAPPFFCPTRDEVDAYRARKDFIG